MTEITITQSVDWHEWEEIILSAREYSFLQSWQQGELNKDLGYKVDRFIISQSGKKLLAFSAAIISAKRGKVMQLRHAPLFLPAFEILGQSEQKEILSMSLDKIRQFAQENACDFVRLQSLVLPKNSSGDSSHLLQLLQANKYKPANIHNIDAEKTLILDITKTEEELMQNMRKQTRYYIRRSAKDGITIKRFKTQEALDAFYEIHHDTTVRQGFISYSHDYYTKSFAFTNSLPDSKLSAEVFLAEYQGKYIAGAIVVFYGRKAFYSDGGSLTEYAKLPASYGIQWEAISRARELGCESYNFWGGVSPEKDDTNYPWYGIDLFKRGFGGERVEYMHAHDLGLSWKYGLTRLWEFYEKKKRGY